MTIAVAGNRAALGVAVAEINLKAIWDIISAIRVARTGNAFVLDGPGRLIAHPDIGLVLLGANDPGSRPLQALRLAIEERGGVAIGQDNADVTVIATLAPVVGPGWVVVAKEPLSEALEPVYNALVRTAVLLLIGSGLAVGLALWLAGRMTGPILQLARGTEKIGAGQFDYRIQISSGDEFEHLADRFNAMAVELKLSQERSDRITRLKRFLAPQVADLVDRIGDEHMLEGRRVEIAAIFGDLRGFTAFSAHAKPEDVMKVLGAYYTAVGVVTDRHEATLTSLSGDGVMILVNAPVARPEPGRRALELAVDMQLAVQTLVVEWRERGHAIGFGVGLASGLATVGQIDSGSRLEYTAIGPVVNLASRLCGAANDGQILIDADTATTLPGDAAIECVGSLSLKGFDRAVTVFSARDCAHAASSFPVDGVKHSWKMPQRGSTPSPFAAR